MKEQRLVKHQIRKIYLSIETFTVDAQKSERKCENAADRKGEQRISYVSKTSAPEDRLRVRLVDMIEWESPQWGGACVFYRSLISFPLACHLLLFSVSTYFNFPKRTLLGLYEAEENKWS